MTDDRFNPVADDLGASMLAHDLSLHRAPDWLRVGALERLNKLATSRPRDEPNGWKMIARIVVEESKLPAAHRSLWGVLIGMDPGHKQHLLELARRSGMRRKAAFAVVRDLMADGWLRVEHRPGQPSQYTLLVPLDEPPDRVAHPANVRVGRVESTRPLQGAGPVDNGSPPSDEDSESRVESTRPVASNRRDPASNRRDPRVESTRHRRQGDRETGGDNPPARVSTSSAADDPRWLTLLGMIERAEHDGALPTLPRAKRQRLADLLAEIHPTADDGRGDDDPAALVLADIASQRPRSPSTTFHAAYASLGLTVLTAQALIRERHRRRQQSA